MRNDSESGFTLLELLVTIIVIGVLAAISIREFNVYKEQSFDARAEHDLRSAVTAEEAYFTDNETYVECQDAACQDALTKFTLSDGTKLTLTMLPAGEGFSAEAYHPKGQKHFRFSSETGTIASL
jgi:type IV pilus assembly protein PilA